MATLERRIDALESVDKGNMLDIVILHEIVTPGMVGAPIRFATIDGERVDIEPGETEDAFRDRLAELIRDLRKRADRRPLVLLRADDAELTCGA